jgi:nicotinamidase-related amidase
MKRALVVVDMIEDFVHEGSARATWATPSRSSRTA